MATALGPEVVLKLSNSGKLHDGARGRLIAAYDPALFEPDYAGVLPEGTATFASVLAEVLADVQEQLDSDDAGQVDADVEDIIKSLLPMDETRCTHGHRPPANTARGLRGL